MNSDALLSRTTRYVLDRFDCGGDKGLKDERMPNGAYDPLLRDNSDASDVIATDITGIPVVLLLVIVLMVDSLTRTLSNQSNPCVKQILLGNIKQIAS
uniref:Uncharacterized protein n=1 Tax=Vespula pensylvanica TaxID=30213 RepID=A0A834U4D3_VESPE|nr:hypothetical protein H0235_012391 [Vespula pensylvanica]